MLDLDRRRCITRVDAVGRRAASAASPLYIRGSHNKHCMWPAIGRLARPLSVLLRMSLGEPKGRVAAVAAVAAVVEVAAVAALGTTAIPAPVGPTARGPPSDALQFIGKHFRRVRHANEGGDRGKIIGGVVVWYPVDLEAWCFSNYEVNLQKEGKIIIIGNNNSSPRRLLNLDRGVREQVYVYNWVKYLRGGRGAEAYCIFLSECSGSDPKTLQQQLPGGDLGVGCCGS